jgi:hypothetical protein
MGDASLSKIINGYREPNSRERKLLAEVLQADEVWLFEKHEPESTLLKTARSDKQTE